MKTRYPLLRRIAPATLLLVLLARCMPATGDDSAGQVWLISTRRAVRCGSVDYGEQKIDFYRLGPDDKWLPENQDTFVETGRPAVPTTIFIHGNRVGPDAAVRDGWRVFRRMKQDAGGRAFRLVIWSWPSDRIAGRQRHDVRVKASYSDVQSYYLAECLHRIKPDVPVGLVGYSFGARIITGALHMLGGGAVACRRLGEREVAKERKAGRTPLRAVLVAAAIDAGWLAPGCRNSLATSQVEEILVTRNRCDPVLRWYRMMYGLRGPQAAGYVGAYCRGESCEKIEQLDVTCSIGRVHDWACYVQAPPLGRRLGWCAFLETAEPEK